MSEFDKSCEHYKRCLERDTMNMFLQLANRELSNMSSCKNCPCREEKAKEDEP